MVLSPHCRPSSSPSRSSPSSSSRPSSSSSPRPPWKQLKSTNLLSLVILSFCCHAVVSQQCSSQQQQQHYQQQQQQQCQCQHQQQQPPQYQYQQQQQQQVVQLYQPQQNIPPAQTLPNPENTQNTQSTQNSQSIQNPGSSGNVNNNNIDVIGDNNEIDPKAIAGIVDTVVSQLMSANGPFAMMIKKETNANSYTDNEGNVVNCESTGNSASCSSNAGNAAWPNLGNGAIGATSGDASGSNTAVAGAGSVVINAQLQAKLRAHVETQVSKIMNARHQKNIDSYNNNEVQKMEFKIELSQELTLALQEDIRSGGARIVGAGSAVSGGNAEEGGTTVVEAVVSDTTQTAQSAQTTNLNRAKLPDSSDNKIVRNDGRSISNSDKRNEMRKNQDKNTVPESIDTAKAMNYENYENYEHIQTLKNSSLYKSLPQIPHEQILSPFSLTSYPRTCDTEDEILLWLAAIWDVDPEGGTGDFPRSGDGTGSGGNTNGGGSTRNNGGVRNSIKRAMPPHFQMYSCSRLLHEMEHHRTTGLWSERVILESFFFSLVGVVVPRGNYVDLVEWVNFEDYEDLDDDENVKSNGYSSNNSKSNGYRDNLGEEAWKSHPLVLYEGWMNDDLSVSICDWGGITCGYTTFGAEEGLYHDRYVRHAHSARGGNGNSIKLRTAEKLEAPSSLLESTSHDEFWAKHMNLVRCNPNNTNKPRGGVDGWNMAPCPPPTSVTKIELSGQNLKGRLNEDLFMLVHLHRLDLSGNRIRGTIPKSYELFQKLEVLDLSRNSLKGPFPKHLPFSLFELWMSNNDFTGNLPNELKELKSLRYFDASNNDLSGTIPSFIGKMSSLRSLYLQDNKFSSTIPDIASLEYLEILDLSDNMLSGALPTFQGLTPSTVFLKNNLLSGTIPEEFYENAGRSLRELDLSNNLLSGTISSSIRWLATSHYLNITANQLTGDVPDLMIIHELLPYVHEYGLDAIMCPPGTFNPQGSAGMFGRCLACPSSEGDKQRKYLGRTTCLSRDFLVGDVNGDGVLSEREILHLLFVFTDGYHWGENYGPWTWTMKETNPCHLPGIGCNSDEKVTRIENANLCSGSQGNGDRCLGLPSEIGLLSNLRVLELSGSTMLQGSLPTEIGFLSNLIFLGLSKCSSMSGSIPSEIGSLKYLQVINVQGSGLSGTLPSTLGQLPFLSTLNLGLNGFSGSVPSEIGNISHLTELVLSRCQLTGTIPETLSNLKELENLELYGNSLTGPIPPSLGKCSSLKRIDLFANNLSSTIPSELANIDSLQIIHLKANRFTGTLPSEIALLPSLTWLDVSGNMISSTIPSAFGDSSHLKDLRLGGNLIHGPIPESLCHNRNLNEGLTSLYGCDAILCPIGTYSEAGFATKHSICKGCPDGQSSMHLGSDSCLTFTQKDFLRMFFDVTSGETWNEVYREGWATNENECEWAGVSCDKNGEVIGLAFPIAGFKNF